MPITNSKSKDIVTYISINYIYIYIYISIYIYMYIYIPLLASLSRSLSCAPTSLFFSTPQAYLIGSKSKDIVTYINKDQYEYIYICIYMYISICINIHVYIYICIYIYTYVYTYIYIPSLVIIITSLLSRSPYCQLSKGLTSDNQGEKKNTPFTASAAQMREL
jgi:hypothetical protein